MTVLKLQVFHGNTMKEWITLEHDVTKIGTLQSSHIILDGLSRMHAVIERSADGFRLIDLGGTPPTFVNGEQIRNVLLNNGDMIHFGSKGPWSMRVAIEKAVEIDAESPPSKDETARLLDEAIQMLKDMEPGGEFDSKNLFELFAAKAGKKKGVLFDGAAKGEDDTSDEDALFETLCDKLSKFAAKNPDRKTTIEQVVEMARGLWKGKSPEKKREQLDRLNDLIRAFEEGEKDKDRMGTAFIETLLRIQAKGEMEKIFTLSVDEALEKAAVLVVEVSQYKDAFALTKTMTEPDSKTEKEYWLRGKHLLEEKLTNEVIDKVMSLSFCLARVGGWTWEQQQASMKQAQSEMTEEQIQAIKEHPLGAKVLEVFGK